MAEKTPTPANEPPSPNEKLVEQLIIEGSLSSAHIIDAFKHIDRWYFVPAAVDDLSYEDQPLPLEKRQTISQPTTVAIMLEKLFPQSGERVLDVGSGSGWATALLGHIVGNNGSVIGVERVPELVAMGKKNLKRWNMPYVRIEAAGDALGWPNDGPYDRILVSAAAHSVPQPLLAQLKNGGTMVIPVRNRKDPRLSSLYVVRKDTSGKTRTEKIPGFAFVPLVH